MKNNDKHLDKAMNDWADSLKRFCRAGVEPGKIHKWVKEAFEKYYKTMGKEITVSKEMEELNKAIVEWNESVDRFCRAATQVVEMSRSIRASFEKCCDKIKEMKGDADAE